MHDCRKIQKELLNKLFDEQEAPEKARLLAAEAGGCPTCRAESATLADVFQNYAEFSALDQPSESYWQNYETTLRRKILAADAPAAKQTVSFSPLALWRRLIAVSIPVPAPIAAAFVALFAVAAFFAHRAPETKIRIVEIPAPSVQAQSAAPQTIEKIVIREKPVERVVTRKIYLPSREKRSQNDSFNSAVARRNEKSQPAPKTPALSLAEFQPPPKIEFKVIKDGAQDEK